MRLREREGEREAARIHPEHHAGGDGGIRPDRGENGVSAGPRNAPIEGAAHMMPTMLIESGPIAPSPFSNSSPVAETAPRTIALSAAPSTIKHAMTATTYFAHLYPPAGRRFLFIDPALITKKVPRENFPLGTS